MSDAHIPDDLRNVKRLIIRGNGSFSVDPKGDWVSARHFDESIAEIERLNKLVTERTDRLIGLFAQQLKRFLERDDVAFLCDEIRDAIKEQPRG